MGILPGVIAAILVAGALLALMLLLLLRGRSGEEGKMRSRGAGRPPLPRRGGKTGDTEPQTEARRGIQPGTCPLCASRLGPGERVKSDLSPGKGDRIMRIFGCPHCWPAQIGTTSRSCPVCGKPIPAEGHAIARFFERPGRKHVHVLGCTSCRSPIGSAYHGR